MCLGAGVTQTGGASVCTGARVSVAGRPGRRAFGSSSPTRPRRAAAATAASVAADRTLGACPASRSSINSAPPRHRNYRSKTKRTRRPAAHPCQVEQRRVIVESDVKHASIEPARGLCPQCLLTLNSLLTAAGLLFLVTPRHSPSRIMNAPEITAVSNDAPAQRSPSLLTA